MKFFVTLSKKNLVIITALAVTSLLIAGGFYSAGAGKIDGSTNALRVEYIKSLGYEVNETAVSNKEITVPQEFGDVYSQYNEIQKQAGFDLSRHKGEKAYVYSYELTFDSETQVHLIVSDGTVIGGDIAEIRLDGEMKPLKEK